MLLAVLVGNSSIRYGFMEAGEVRERGVVPLPPPGIPLVGNWFPRGESVDVVVIGSVNPGRLTEVVRSGEGLGHRVLVAGRDLPVNIPNRYRNPAQAGMDRILNSLAASHLWPGKGVVVLDFGTALSVSAVSPAGEFLGGPIAPGLGSAAAGLELRAAQLPLVHPNRWPARLLSITTRDAMEAGICWLIAGGTTRILEELARELPFPFHTVATGGDAPLFAPAIPGIDRVDPDLALKGLWTIHVQRKE